MTVKVREWKKGNQVGFEVDIRLTYPDGASHRQRIKAPVESRSAAKRWGEARERELLLQPSPAVLRQQQVEQKRKEVPTVAEFADRFIEGYATAERHKASGIDSKRIILRKYLVPRLGSRKLDALTNEDVQSLKGELANKRPKTVNNVLTVLGRMLRVAIEWDVIETMPCRVRLLKVNSAVPTFYEFSEYARLVEAADKLGTRTLLVVLLGGDAGLRRGEMIALRWCDVDFRRKQLVVQQAEWRATIDTPKSGKGRIVPMTDALDAALRTHRHLRGERVLYRDNGVPPRCHHVREWIAAAQRRAGLPASGALHVLRHTFCSHLAMRGAPAKAIQELAGHAHLSTTLRYMHLSPAARSSAIDLLNARPLGGEIFGDIVEKEVAAITKA
jgi:integrase